MLDTEIDSLLAEWFPEITKKQFSAKLGVVTGEMIGSDFLLYMDDVELAIRCCLENREQTSLEFD